MRNQRFKERYYDRIRRKVCVKCESPVLITARLCEGCLMKDREQNKKYKYEKPFHTNKLADVYNSFGIIMDKTEKVIEEIR